MTQWQCTEEGKARFPQLSEKQTNALLQKKLLDKCQLRALKAQYLIVGD